MAVLNFAHHEITAKIVYFGPSGAGCNSNVRGLHQQLNSEEATARALHAFGPPDSDERTWYFDHPVEAHGPAGFAMRLRVYSMPGGLDDDEHRRAVMQELDAVVMVVDSRPGRAKVNEEALLELEALVEDQGLDLATLPVVLQVNHLDHAEAADPADVVRALNPYGFPVLGASAREGSGVLETFEAIRDITQTRITDQLDGNASGLALTAVHEDRVHTDEDVVREHLARFATLERFTQPDAPNATPATPIPGDQVEVAFQPREFAGSSPHRVVQAGIEDGQVFIDIELRRMNGEEVRPLRVKLANRPADVPAVVRAPVASLVTEDTPAVMGVTDHLPDRISIGADAPPAGTDFPPVLYGVIGVVGGILVGLLTAFLLLR